MNQHSLDRRHHYKDVELLIDQGFILHHTSVLGVSLTLRSLFPREIREVTAQTHDKGVFFYRLWVVIRSLYSVNGWLIDDPLELYSFVRQFPKKLIHRLFYQTLGLMNRYQRSMEIAQAYAYEPYGRHTWFTYGRDIPQNGFGLVNGIQTLWQFVNIIEDRFEDSEMHWNHAKFIASAMSPKGVKKQNSKDEQAKKKRESDREQYILKALKFQVMEGDSETPILVNAKTDEELMAEYKRWVAGEQDNHDLIVQNYKESIRAGMEQRDEEARARVAELVGDGERGVFSATTLMGEETIKEAFKSSVRSIEHEGSQKRLYKRFLGREEVGGDFFVDENGSVKRR